jgi:hypothetical protein
MLKEEESKDDSADDSADDNAKRMLEVDVSALKCEKAMRPVCSNL